MSRETVFREAIQSSGLRMTRQRQLVLEVLEESRQHLDAEAIHDRVRARDPRVGLATVYRTLALLKEIGLVEEHRLGEEHGHFEAVADAPHYHFTCLKCRRVIEFEAPLVDQVIGELVERHGIQVVEAHLNVSGYCAACSEEAGALPVRHHGSAYAQA
ncbi:MAG: transcriptional repressor [Chloroflexota bacterium]